MSDFLPDLPGDKGDDDDEAEVSEEAVVRHMNGSYTTSIDFSSIGIAAPGLTVEERLAKIEKSLAWIESEMRADKAARLKSVRETVAAYREVFKR